MKAENIRLTDVDVMIICSALECWLKEGGCGEKLIITKKELETTFGKFGFKHDKDLKAWDWSSVIKEEVKQSDRTEYP